MWYLTSETDHRILYILPKKEVTIGRSLDGQVCNFAIVDDPSISRRHVTLLISDNELILQDLGSRYGTFLNNSSEKLACNAMTKISNNDVIKLGKMGSVWTAHEVNFITCTSTLKGESVNHLKINLEKIGGVLKAEWDDFCKYLTMPAITLTIKVVLALVQGSHIVTLEFWNECVEAINNQKALPNPDLYTPEIIESTLNKEIVSFLPNAQRKALFLDKTFIFFLRRQLDMYKVVLEKSGASALLLSDTKMTKSNLLNENMIVIQYNVSNTSQETQTQKNQIADIVNYLKSKGKRVISDAEIGLAILYCSTAKYCNPDFNFSVEVIKQTNNQNPSSGVILAQESQEKFNKVTKGNVIINESLTSTTMESTNPKRKLSIDDDDITNANKKIAADNTIVNVESGKRKHSVLDCKDTTNPVKKVALDKNESDNDEIFNFVPGTNDNKQINTTEKKLNLSRPLKRKDISGGNEEDDLFNFVPDKVAKESTETSKGNIFNVPINNKETNDEIKKTVKDENLDISAMRGIKLKELSDDKNLNSNCYPTNIKKEISDELDKKMNHLTLGTTIVTVRSDLIVKKEPIEIEAHNVQVKNFKKFKKIWPVKMQVSIIPNSSSSTVHPERSNFSGVDSMSY